jgi:hypothetical protein
MKTALLSLCLAPLGSLPALSASACEDLSRLKLPNAEIATAKTIAAGAFRSPFLSASAPVPQAFLKAPAFCRVALELKPTSDSDIKVEVWMPAAGWNGRFQGLGNGGFAGSIDYNNLAAAVTQGYAAAATDTGHMGEATNAKWALGHPEKVNDFGWRGIHLTSVAAKSVIEAWGGRSPAHSYFAGCSDGGREALMEAQRFPADYDGIIAGAPANQWTRLLSKSAADTQALESDAASYIPASKIHAISTAVLAACDAQDGVADGIVSDPTRCHFDPASLLCKDGASDACLTAPQIAGLKTVYAPLRNGRGEAIYPGYEPGGEEGFGGWGLWITGQHPGGSLQYAFSTGYFSNMVFDPSWDYRRFNVDAALAAAVTKTAAALDATDANLTPFRARGGKLILDHGWSDAAIPPRGTVDYYNAVIAAMGRSAAESFVRLYMAPGLQHCAGGPGPDSFRQFGPLSDASDPRHDMTTALEQWVEKGVAPGAIVATKYARPFDASSAVKMTRPLCPWPQAAVYKGSGDTNDAANFVCGTEK